MADLSILELVDEWIFSAIPAVGFAVLFNVPKRLLKYCALLGGFGHVFRTLLICGPFEKPVATFVACAGIGFVGILIARHLQSYPEVFTVASIIPMFPGLPAYRAMISLIQINNLGYSAAFNEQMITHFLQLTFQLGAIVGGLALPGLLFFRRRPVV